MFVLERVLVSSIDSRLSHVLQSPILVTAECADSYSLTFMLKSVEEEPGRVGKVGECRELPD